MNYPRLVPATFTSIDQDVTGIIWGMNGMPPLSALRRNIRDAINDVLTRRFFRDRLSMALLVGAGVVNGMNIL